MTEFLAFVVTLPTWTSPLLATIVLWGILLNLPSRGASNVMDFTPLIEGIGRLFIGVVGTLVFWMIYFALT